MEFTDIIVLPVIIALVEGAKRILGLPSKWLFPLSLLLGEFGGIFLIYPSDLKAGIFIGLIMGLAASGLWSGAKTAVEKE